jgi:hypothetical protein
LRRRKKRLPALPWGPTLLAGLHAGVALKKKKTPTTIKKQTEAHLKELYLRFIKVQKYDPDYWRKSRYDDFDDYKFMIAMVERERDAGRVSEETFELVKRELGGLTIAKVYLREKLGSEIESCISEGDPILSIMEQLKPPPELLVDLFTHVFNPSPNEIPPVALGLKSNGELTFKIDLRFTDNKIMEAMGRYLEYYLSPLGQRLMDLWGYRPQLEDGRVLEVIRDPGKGPYGQDLESSMLVVSINFDAGKMKIKKELKELLKKLSPRDTKSTRFHPDTWELAYEIYRLSDQEGLKFKEITNRVGKPYKTVKRLHKTISEHIHQKEYGTPKIREQDTDEEYPFSDANNGWGTWISYKGAPSVKKAEKHFAKQCDTGRRIPRLHEEEPDEYAPFQSVLVGQLDKSLAGTAFEKLIKRTCLKQLLKAEGYEQCGYEPGSKRCKGCNQGLEENRKLGLWKKIQLITDGIPWNAYVESFKYAPIEAAIKKGIPKNSYIAYRYQRIDEEATFVFEKNLPRKKELKWQREYIKKYGVKPWVVKFTWDGEKTTRNIIVAENFGPIGHKPIEHYPRAPVVPCADCGGECPTGDSFPCDKVLKWTQGRHFPRGEPKKYRKRTYCPSCMSSNTVAHLGVWVCQCEVWFTPVAERYDELLSEFTKSLASGDVGDSLISLLDEGREYGVDQIFETTLPVPIEKVSLGLKERGEPITLSERKPLQTPWYPKEAEKPYLKVVTQSVMPLYKRMRDISWKQGFYWKSRVLTLTAILCLDIRDHRFANYWFPHGMVESCDSERWSKERILTLNENLYSEER